MKLAKNNLRENELPLGSNYDQFKVFKMSVKLYFQVKPQR